MTAMPPAVERPFVGTSRAGLPVIRNPVLEAGEAEGLHVADDRAAGVEDRLKKRPAVQNYGKSFQVTCVGAPVRLQRPSPAIVDGCCDEGEAIRLYCLHHCIEPSKYRQRAASVEGPQRKGSKR